MMFKICLLLAVVLTVNGEFEEYFKWKQIQFAGVESCKFEAIFVLIFFFFTSFWKGYHILSI